MGQGKRLLIVCIFAGSVAFSLPALGAPQAAQAQPQAAPDTKKQDKGAPPARAATPDASQFVGSETCKACHEVIFNNWEKTPHWKTTLDTKGGPSHQGCEGCHGPGAAHVAGGGDKTKIFIFKDHSTKEINERCLTCHVSDKQQSDAARSMHVKNNVSCISCHSPHHAKESELLLVKAQPELCFSCHVAQKPDFNMPFHHRVVEGLVQCTDCHNPHGAPRSHQLRTSAAQDVVCFSCHVDKRGPFVFEHQPVKIEGCASCHTPHGSPNPHLLKFSNVNILCLQCHTMSSFSSAPGAPSFHNQGAQYQACTLCHVQIHGSNFDPTFFK